MNGWEGYAAEQARDGAYAAPGPALAEVAEYEADEGPLGCDHDEDELDGDEHRANCLYYAKAAKRLEAHEARWDLQGIRGCGR